MIDIICNNLSYTFWTMPLLVCFDHVEDLKLNNSLHKGIVNFILWMIKIVFVYFVLWKQYCLSSLLSEGLFEGYLTAFKWAISWHLVALRMKFTGEKDDALKLILLISVMKHLILPPLCIRWVLALLGQYRFAWSTKPTVCPLGEPNSFVSVNQSP